MLNSRIRGALVALVASAGLAACSSYGPYGGSGVSVGLGYGSPYGYGYGSPYGYGYGSPYGYGSSYYGYPYFGWYDGFYYPGAGYWIYDPWGHQYPITQKQSNFWSNQLKKFREAGGTAATQTAIRENFSGFRAKAKSGATIKGVDLDAHVQAQARADRASVQQINDVRRQAQIERIQQARAEREARFEARTERQESIRQEAQERQETRRHRRGGGGE